jgi:hypothetical protein
MTTRQATATAILANQFVFFRDATAAIPGGSCDFMLAGISCMLPPVSFSPARRGTTRVTS